MATPRKMEAPSTASNMCCWASEILARLPIAISLAILAFSVYVFSIIATGSVVGVTVSSTLAEHGLDLEIGIGDIMATRRCNGEHMSVGKLVSFWGNKDGGRKSQNELFVSVATVGGFGNADTFGAAAGYKLTFIIGLGPSRIVFVTFAGVSGAGAFEVGDVGDSAIKADGGLVASGVFVIPIFLRCAPDTDDLLAFVFFEVIAFGGISSVFIGGGVAAFAVDSPESINAVIILTGKAATTGVSENRTIGTGFNHAVSRDSVAVLVDVTTIIVAHFIHTLAESFEYGEVNVGFVTRVRLSVKGKSRLLLGEVDVHLGNGDGVTAGRQESGEDIKSTREDFFVVGQSRDVAELIFNSKKIIEITVRSEFGRKIIDGAFFAVDGDLLATSGNTKNQGDADAGRSDNDTDEEDEIAKFQGFNHFVLDIGNEVDFAMISAKSTTFFGGKLADDIGNFELFSH